MTASYPIYIYIPVAQLSSDLATHLYLAQLSTYLSINLSIHPSIDRSIHRSIIQLSSSSRYVAQLAQAILLIGLPARLIALSLIWCSLYLPNQASTPA